MISFVRSAQASKARCSLRHSVLSQSRRMYLTWRSDDVVRGWLSGSIGKKKRTYFTHDRGCWRRSVYEKVDRFGECISCLLMKVEKKSGCGGEGVLSRPKRCNEVNLCPTLLARGPVGWEKRVRQSMWRIDWHTSLNRVSTCKEETLSGLELQVDRHFD